MRMSVFALFCPKAIDTCALLCYNKEDLEQ